MMREKCKTEPSLVYFVFCEQLLLCWVLRVYKCVLRSVGRSVGRLDSYASVCHTLHEKKLNQTEPQTKKKRREERTRAKRRRKKTCILYSNLCVLAYGSSCTNLNVSQLENIFPLILETKREQTPTIIGQYPNIIHSLFFYSL